MVFALRNYLRFKKANGNLWELDQLFIKELQPEAPKMRRRRKIRLFGLL